MARGLSPKKIITVFGCGGDRDRSKRPLMGQAAGEASDFVVLTSHVGARFFLHEWYRSKELAALADLRDEIAKQGPGAPLFIVGFEYTDHRQGHLG